ncbi:MAG: DUF167 domain-containing protein [Desulfovibrio sp.]|jgi:hypothetical protein|nr:DUF167 domain-containing protein [Desulfovibrio sp.]
MVDRPPYAGEAKGGGLRVLVWVQPGAKQDAAVGVVDGRLKVKLKAQAQENKANEALVVFLAKCLGLPRSSLELTSGQTSRKKTIRVKEGFEPDWRALDKANHEGN